MRSWLERMKRKSTWAWLVATFVELSMESIVAASVVGASLLLVSAPLLLAYFPYSHDTAPSPAEIDRTRTFYTKVYDKADASQAPEKDEDAPSKEYEEYAQAAIRDCRVKETIEAFAQKFDLQKKKVLDVGSGSGYLQDVLEDYTGLDISPSARRLYHKPFVAGSATAMPFADDTFDGVWTIWVLEHVPNPEQALREIRRVTKDGGVLFLAPAWEVPSWAADGCDYRPYSDYGIPGKLMKASIPVQRFFADTVRVLAWPARQAAWRVTGEPMSFRYRRLTPNYAKYLGPDSDAVNSLDRNEVALWFTSRGDECLDCESIWSAPKDRLQELIIRVHKKS